MDSWPKLSLYRCQIIGIPVRYIMQNISNTFAILSCSRATRILAQLPAAVFSIETQLSRVMFT